MRKFVYSQKRLFSKVILSNLFYSISVGVIPLITKSFFDRVNGIGLSSFMIVLIMYFFAISFGMIFQYINQTCGWKLEKNINIEIKSSLLRSILDRDFEKFTSESIGSYISKIDNDVETVVKNYINGYIEVIQGIIQYCIYAIFLSLVDFRIAIVMIMASWLVVIVPRFTSKEFAQRKMKHLELVGEYFDKVRGILEGYSLVNSKTKPKLLKKGEEFTIEMESGLLRFGEYKSLVNVLTGFLTYSMNLISFALIGFLLLNNKISLGTGVATLGYMSNLVFPVRYILDNFNLILSAKGTKDSLFAHISKKYYVDKPDFECKEIEIHNASINFENYSIENINLKFDNGQRYYLSGKSGTGKTTLISVMCGKQKLSTGKIEFSGRDVSVVYPEDIVSCVFQNDYIFPASFYENVTVFGSYDSQRVNELVRYFPQTLTDKLLNAKDCTVLSGGEKQVLSLIRCKIRNKGIYLLDEPFSAMDSITKEKAKAFVLSELKGILVLSSHEKDLDFQSKFDKILYFENNTIL